MRINAHSHLLPYPEEIPNFMREKEIFWLDKERKYMLQKNWKRPVTDTSFFLSEKLLWMDENCIDHAVVLNLSQLYGNGLSYEDMDSALRFQNDFNAKVQANHPHKFTCGFVVQPFFKDWALKEIERCTKQLGLSLLCLPTHFMNAEGKWENVFCDENEVIFELANEYNLAIEVHPYNGEQFIHLENKYWRFHLIWMLAQCADAFHFYTLKGYYDKFPNIRVCFAHGGQLAQMNIGRRIQGFEGRPDLFPNLKHPKLATGHPNIYFDTLVHDQLAFELMIRRLGGTNQILFGLDDPYPLGEMELDNQSSCYPGKLLQESLESGLISEQQSHEICYNNILKWLGFDDESFKHKINP